MKRNFIIPGLVFATTLPFLLLFLTIDYSASREAVVPQLYTTGASIFGLIGATLLFWQFFFGSRYFVSFITPDIIFVNRFHRAVGKYAILLVLAHPLLLAYGVVKDWTWIYTPSFATEIDEHVNFGRLALLLLAVIWVTSVLVRSKIKYRPWRYTHYLGYVLLFFVFLHAEEIGVFLNSMPALRYFWNTIEFIFYLTVLYRLVYGYGIGRKSYVLSKKETVGRTIALLTFLPKGKRIVPAVGQYCYIQLGHLGESHPYTIMDYDEGTGALTLGVKDVGSFSRKLQELAEGVVVRFDGPYGVFTREGQNTEPKVVIAGGIGITPFFRFLRKYGKSAVFLYANRKQEDIVRRDALMQAVGEGYYEVINEEGGVADSHTRYGKLDRETIKESVGGEYLSRNYFVCGSPGFIIGMREELKKMGVPKQQVFFESLGY